MSVEVFHMLELSDEEMNCLWALLLLLERSGKLTGVEMNILCKVDRMCKQ